jgi:hypothetical protein
MASPRRYATVSMWAGVALLAVSIYFFLAAVSYMSASAVVASLLSAVIGFAVLSSATALIRTYVIARAVEENPKPK